MTRPKGRVMASCDMTVKNMPAKVEIKNIPDPGTCNQNSKTVSFTIKKAECQRFQLAFCFLYAK